jgi:hypothetical protein
MVFLARSRDVDRLGLRVRCLLLSGRLSDCGRWREEKKRGEDEKKYSKAFHSGARPLRLRC